jgi:hypothetical protein
VLKPEGGLEFLRNLLTSSSFESPFVLLLHKDVHSMCQQKKDGPAGRRGGEMLDK